MKNILILTMPNDSHAILVKLALQLKGHACKLLYTSDIPTRQTHSFEIQNDFKWYVDGVDVLIENETFDVIWNRRPRTPRMDSELHHDDKHNAHLENLSFYHSINTSLSDKSVWINTLESSKKANSKIFQMSLAVELNFNVPITLFSNDPSKIREFFACHRDKEIIYKTYSQLLWQEDKGLRLSYTNTIEPSELPSDNILQRVPGIYQLKVDKKYELRVTYFSDEYVAIKIHSQEHIDGALDWRKIPQEQLHIEECDLPIDVHQKCLDFMERLGLKFGCFDFVVTPQDEYIFLEINEQGQFLWIEEINPNIHVLDKFVNFILKEAGANITCNHPVLMSNLESEAEAIQNVAQTVHVNPDAIMRL